MRVLLILITVFFVALLCPRQSVSDYTFGQGEIWQYEDLVANRDIPLLKLPEELKSEEDTIRANSKPYFQFLSSVKNENIKNFISRFDEEVAKLDDREDFRHLKQNRDLYQNYAVEWLEYFFDKGMVSDELNSTQYPVVNLIRGNTSNLQLLRNLPREKENIQLFKDTLRFSGLNDAEFLLPLVPDFIEANIVYSDSLSSRFLALEMESILKAKGLIKQGSTIATSGEYIGPATYRRLYSYKAFQDIQRANSLSKWAVLAGYIILLSLLMTIFWLYLVNTMPELLQGIKHLLFSLLFINAYSYLTFAVESIDGLSAYIIPFVIVPMVVRIFYSDRLALFVHLVIVIIVSLISKEGYQFTVIQLMAGIAAILSKPSARNWNAFFKSIIWIFVSYTLSYVGISLLQGGVFVRGDFQFIIWLALNALFCLLAFPLIPLLERLFGFTSDFSLVELSDLNHPLLKDMAEHASGTLQHSLQVSNLAEAAAERISANSLLVKVAALYHDIGKLKNPEYFIENQKAENPHDKMSALDSAAIIIGHVTNGIKIAQEHKLPAPIVDFIKTHHGTTRVEYFYRRFLDEQKDKEANYDESTFRYPGPLPYTKEQAILMIADSLEAASKSLKSPDAEGIDKLVDAIVSAKLAQGQLVHAPLTFRELEECKEVFKSRLKSMNHVRIAYPK